MRDKAFFVFKVAIFIVLIAKILNWFLDFSDETNAILNTVMFSLIGLAYIVVGLAWNHKFLKAVIILCGVYLIVFNFLERQLALSLVGIACLIIPMIIGVLSPETKEENTTTVSK